MGKDHPDHHDAELAFRAYELRREAVMRESRNAINRDFWPKAYADVLAVTKFDHPLNADREELRRDVSPVAFQNAEWVAKNTAVGQRVFAMFTARVQKLLAAR